MPPPPKHIRDRWSKLREFFNAQDPAGLIACGAPPDEYDCITGPLLRQLHQQATPAQIADDLTTHFRHHFAMELPDAHPLAQRLVSWYQALDPGTKAE